MATHTQHNQNQLIYFITFSCYRWISLFEESNSYNSVYKCFHHLLTNNINVIGYVTMPNHFHGLLYLGNSPQANLNKLVSNGKRFMAYDIINSLKGMNKQSILHTLRNDVSDKEKQKGKNHRVFISSFDAFYCQSKEVVEQKLDYIHHNPVSKKWLLVDDFTEYEYSSAVFYENGIPNHFITHYMEIVG